MDNKKTLNLGLATLPIVAMLLLLIIGYGQFGLRIEPLLLVSAAIAAALAGGKATAGTTSSRPSWPSWRRRCR